MHAALYPTMEFGDFLPRSKKKRRRKKMWGTGSPFKKRKRRNWSRSCTKIYRKRPANASWFNFFSEEQSKTQSFIIVFYAWKTWEEGNLKEEKESRFPPTNHKMAARHENRKTFPNRKHIKQSRLLLWFDLPTFSRYNPPFISLYFLFYSSILLRNFVYKTIFC